MVRSDSIPSGSSLVVDPAGLKDRTIVFVLPSTDMGGAERQALILGRFLRDSCAANVKFLALGETNTLHRIFEQEDFAYESYRLPPAGARARQLHGFYKLGLRLRRLRPDVLMPYGMVPNVVCGFFWQFARARVCVWNQRSDGVGRMAPRLEKASIKRVSSFLSNSDAGAQFLNKEFGIEPGAVTVIPNGIDLSPPRHDRNWWKEELSSCESGLVCSMIANLTRHKDHATLLRAWRSVTDRMSPASPRPVLALAGRLGETYPGLESLALELGIERDVRFLGLVDDVSGLLSASDVGVLSSPSEGSPNGVLECMAAGLPVVGTNIRGIEDALGETDHLAPPGDAVGLADRILFFLNNPDQRTFIGSENQQRVNREFGVPRMGERTARFLIEQLA